MNILIRRVFIKMRAWSSGYSELMSKSEALQASEAELNKQIEEICFVMQELLKPVWTQRRPVEYR